MIDCPTCHGAGEVYGFSRSINPFSGVEVNDPQCVDYGPCPRCHGGGVIGVEPVWSDITLADTLNDEELGRFLEDRDGFLEEYEQERAA